MLYLAVVFLVVALIASILGLFGIASMVAMAIAKLAVAIFMVCLIGSFVVGSE